MGSFDVTCSLTSGHIGYGDKVLCFALDKTLPTADLKWDLARCESPIKAYAFSEYEDYGLVDGIRIGEQPDYDCIYYFREEVFDFLVQQGKVSTTSNPEEILLQICYFASLARKELQPYSLIGTQFFEAEGAEAQFQLIMLQSQILRKNIISFRDSLLEYKDELPPIVGKCLSKLPSDY